MYWLLVCGQVTTANGSVQLSTQGGTQPELGLGCSTGLDIMDLTAAAWQASTKL